MEINPRGINKAKDGARFDFTLFGRSKNVWDMARYKFEIRNTGGLRNGSPIYITSPKDSYNLTYSYSSSINRHSVWAWDAFDVKMNRRFIYGNVYTKGDNWGFSEYEIDFDSDRARQYNRHGGKLFRDYSSVIIPHSEKSEMYKHRYCWKKPANCRDIKIDYSISTLHPLRYNGGGRGVTSTQINYYGRSGRPMGSAIIRFINDNPVYTRMYYIDRNGDESYQGTVDANSYKDMKTTIN
jgi:hypothetical protein